MHRDVHTVVANNINNMNNIAIRANFEAHYGKNIKHVKKIRCSTYRNKYLHSRFLPIPYINSRQEVLNRRGNVPGKKSATE